MQAPNGTREGDDPACWAAIHGVEGVGPALFRRLLHRFGTAAGVLAQTSEEAFAPVRGITREVTAGLLRARQSLDIVRREVETLQSRGVRILRLGAPDYPAALLDLPNPPPLLYVVGTIDDRRAPIVSMVGTTKPSDKGRRIAEIFARRFAEAETTVVSGFAHGIDAAAHRGAFGAGGRSILCVPYGIRRFKPRMDMPPLQEIAERGALVSECPPDREWSSQAAVARDRIIAALGRALFVVETRRRGGTMHTVKAASQLGRPLFALKYRQPPESAAGNSVVIARGATAIRTFGDIAAILERIGGEISA